MKIKTVQKTEHGQYVTLTLVGEKKPFILTGELYRALGELSAGDEVGDEEYSEITAADEYYRATKKALNILSFGDNSARKLYEKLRRGAIGSELARRVVSDMVELGYIDEEKQLRRLVLRLANESLWGAKRISAKLIASGYNPSQIQCTISSLSSEGEIDFWKNLNVLSEKMLGAEPDDEALARLKYKYGYK